MGIDALKLLLKHHHSLLVGVLLETDEIVKPLPGLDEVDVAHFGHSECPADFHQLVVDSDQLRSILVSRQRRHRIAARAHEQSLRWVSLLRTGFESDLADDAAEAPDVGCLAVVLVLQYDFGGSVPPSESVRRKSFLRGLRHAADESEVADLDLHVWGQQQVVGLEVSVNQVSGVQI